MHFLDYVLDEPESSNSEYYHLNWLDSSDSRAGPYGEPLQYQLQELHDESKFPAHEEAENGFITGSWYYNHEGNDQIQLPYQGRSDWLDEYESYYFAGCRGPDVALQDDQQWPSLDFGLAVGIDEFYQDHSWKDPQPVYDDYWSETKLWESLFGHWPCLVHPERESPAVPSHY